MVVLVSHPTSSIGIEALNPTRDDMRLVTKLIGGKMIGDERWKAVTRLCQIAAGNGCLAVRTALATVGGLNPNNVAEFTRAVGVPLGQEMCDTAFGNVISRARDARSEGDYESFTTLVASVGIFPPELSDDIVISPAPEQFASTNIGIDI